MSDIDPNVRDIVPDLEGNTNRGRDIAVNDNDPPQITITLEFINSVIMDYFQNTIVPSVDDNGNRRTVPILYGTPERWSTIRKDGVLRDVDNSKLLTPLIVLRRSGIKEGQPINPNNKYIYSHMETGWNARNAYDKFAVLNRINPSRQMRSVIVPDYIDLTYDVVMWTDYQIQMDDLIQQTIMEAREFWGHRNNFKFRVKIDSFELRSELPSAQDRTVRTEFQMTVQAYLIPERMVRNFKLAATNQQWYTAKKVVAITETVSDIKKLR